MADTAFIHMGTLTRPHGIKGEICVDWYADSPELLRKPFFLQAGGEPPRPVSSVAVRLHKGQPLVLLEGVRDRTAAEGLRGVRILVRREDLPEPDADEVYLHDILGLDVLEDATGRRLGVLEHVEFPNGQEVWSIRTDDNKEILFPAVEEFIAAFDLENGRIRIAPPPGLLELYLGESSS